jgi:hypothetical protein
MSYGEKIYDEIQEMESNMIIGLDTSGWVAQQRGWRPDYPILDKSSFRKMSHLFTKDSWFVFDRLSFMQRMWIENMILLNSNNGFCGFRESNFIDEDGIEIMLVRLKEEMDKAGVEA